MCLDTLRIAGIVRKVQEGEPNGKQRLKKLKNQISFISNVAGGVACKFQIWLAWFVDHHGIGGSAGHLSSPSPLKLKT
jgi:hypothetical protein